MKKVISLLAAVLLVASTSVTAFAGNHHGRNTVPYSLNLQTRTSVCAIESCEIAGLHYHNGTSYAAHYYGDGHDYHGYCAVEDCLVNGYHAHDNVFCFGHAYNDGHDYHGYCNYSGCGYTGYHEHDGSYCFPNAYGNRASSFRRHCR